MIMYVQGGYLCLEVFPQKNKMANIGREEITTATVITPHEK